MPKGKVLCPVCLGAGTVTEDTEAYEFESRDPITSRCLICDGSGEPARLALRRRQTESRLNVKRMGRRDGEMARLRDGAAGAALVDTGLGYKPSARSAGAASVSDRLDKVLRSGKGYLIVTDTEPYYLDVYRLIRNQERDQGSWSVEDEERYVRALEGWYDGLKNQDKENKRNG